MKAERSRIGLLFWSVAVATLLPWAQAADPPAKDTDPEEPKKLNEIIEKSVDWYDVFPDDEAKKALTPKPVLRWRNVVRGQVGEAMMVIWAHNGRPVAMASIYPWNGNMAHEFDSLSRGNKVLARDKDRLIWSPMSAGVEFKAVPSAPQPAKSPAERLLQMKAIAEQFKATMTGWRGDNTDREELRLLPRHVYRYELTKPNEPDPDLVDGALLAYVLGTDPEVILVLEAIGNAEKSEWQYAFVRATSGGLEVKRGADVVWMAEKYPANENSTLPHFTMKRLIVKE